MENGKSTPNDWTDEKLARRVVAHEKAFRKQAINVLATAFGMYVVLAALREGLHFISGDGAGPIFELTLQPSHSLAVLGVLATLIVATNVASWTPSFTDAASWESYARQRSARLGNEILGFIAAFLIPPTLFHDAPNSFGIMHLAVTFAALVVVGAAADGTFAVDRRNPAQLRIQKVGLDNEIERLTANARDLASNSSYSRKALYLRTTLELLAIIGVTALASRCVALLFLTPSDGTYLPWVGSIAVAAISTVTAVYFGFYSRLAWATLDHFTFFLQIIVGLGVYSLVALGALDVLSTDIPAALAARLLLVVVIVATPLMLILLGSAKSRSYPLIPRAPRILIDRRVHRAIERRKARRAEIGRDLARRTLLLPHPNSHPRNEFDYGSSRFDEDPGHTTRPITSPTGGHPSQPPSNSRPSD
ncbi:hypothetical protein [Rhodococcus pyridinivorans]